MVDTQKPPDPNDKQAPLELYLVYLEDFGRLGARHETLRQFYLSVISALFVFLAMAGGEDGLFQPVRGGVVVIVGLVGSLICLAWLLHMQSFGALFNAKLVTLRRLETGLASKPFTTEEENPESQTRWRLTSIDQCVAGVFIGLFVGLVFLKW